MTEEELRTATTAFISAIAEGLRLIGPTGIPEDELYAAVSTMASRSVFDMVASELIEQKTVKRDNGRLIYTGPASNDKDQIIGWCQRCGGPFRKLTGCIQGCKGES